MNADNNSNLRSYRRLSAFIGGCFLFTALACAQSPSPAQREYKLSPQDRERAIQFSRAKYTLHFVETAWGLLILFGVLELGWAARTRTLAESASRRWFVQGLIFAPLITLLM